MPVINTHERSPLTITSFEISDASASSSGILPATRARLVSLKDFGAKKIGALRLKLAESRIKQTEKGLTDSLVTVNASTSIKLLFFFFQKNLKNN